MSRMNWTILALLLMIPGAAGLGWGTVQRRNAARQAARAAEAIAEAPSADEYLRMYTKWSQLSATEKADTPWGQGQYGGTDIQKRFREHQDARLEADLPDLDAGVKTYPTQLADVLYGRQWDQRLAQYRRAREFRDLVSTGSGILLFAGALLFCGELVKWLTLRALRTVAVPDESEAAPPQNKDKDKELPRAEALTAASPTHEKEADNAVAAPPLEAVNSDASSSSECGYFESSGKHQKNAALAAMAKPRPLGTVSAESANYATPVSLVDSASAPQPQSYFGWEAESSEQDSMIATLMTTHPVACELTELTEEVSAIRQYAAAQQDQIRKFQDGYDWMIIRRFCMRIIRCIDNLEDRLSKLDGTDDPLQECLQDIRDELVFALESSGVEQFSPDLKTPFKGLERYVEAIRQRVPATNAALAGTIAEIVRPGYQYLVNDDEVKIVRCAQVKLYDAVDTEA